jgi:hypothetical protein
MGVENSVLATHKRYSQLRVDNNKSHSSKYSPLEVASIAYKTSDISRSGAGFRPGRNISWLNYFNPGLLLAFLTQRQQDTCLIRCDG